MKTIALRFSDSFAPECGTIKAHEEVIKQYGYVWYGKLGSTLSDATISEVLQNEEPRILLIHSGRTERYWALVTKIQKVTPSAETIPLYYRKNTENFHCWFCVKQFILADKDVMSKCIVPSSKNSLSNVSRHSMSPYFKIEWTGSSSEMEEGQND